MAEPTGREITYAYYMELVKAYQNRTITDDERYDLELAMAKYMSNAYFR